MRGIFYDNCPKLSKEKRDLMENELLEGDLLMALNTWADSAPEPDGIPYSTYKKLWSVVGSYILNSWKHSCNTGVLPASHSDDYSSTERKKRY
jgi:hypothetical protein